MKAVEVLNKVITGKRISSARKRTYNQAFASWMKFSEDWPEEADTVNRWIAQMSTEYSDETVLTYFNAILAAGAYLQRAGGRRSEPS